MMIGQNVQREKKRSTDGEMSEAKLIHRLRRCPRRGSELGSHRCTAARCLWVLRETPKRCKGKETQQKGDSFAHRDRFQ